MLLVVDVGNTQTHFGVYRDGEDVVAEHWRFATVRESTRDELGAALANLLGLRGLGFTDIDRSIVSSTVPQLSQEWTAMSGLYLDHEMLNVGPAIRTGMPIRIDNPREVGADRLVNAIAAYARFGRACVVVDFGTAITYDAVSDLRRVPRRDHHARGGDLARRALRARGQAAQGGAPGAAGADRQVDRRGHPQRDRLRIRRPGRGDRRAAAAGAGRGHAGDRHRRAWPRWSSRSRARPSTRSTTCSP